MGGKWIGFTVFKQLIAVYFLGFAVKRSFLQRTRQLLKFLPVLEGIVAKTKHLINLLFGIAITKSFKSLLSEFGWICHKGIVSWCLLFVKFGGYTFTKRTACYGA